jgi:UDP:flavonoid glycosyltransferase YjiC (YdhE family)
MGTTAEVLKSGIPSIPVPHMIDQFAWAKRIHSIGVSTKPISRKELTAQSLANAITEAVSNTQIKDKAKAISEQINSENGIADAVRAIEDAML